MRIRMPIYRVTYSRVTKQYAVIVEGKAILVHKKNGAWYASRKYHRTLRDAIIYVVFGL